jgi:hypothetical protein
MRERQLSGDGTTDLKNVLAAAPRTPDRFWVIRN